MRPAAPGDIPAIAEIERLSFADPWSRESFDNLVGDPRVEFRVADVEGAVVGYVILWVILDEAELANIAVAPAARGHGHGAALLDGALGCAAERGVVATHLEVRESNVVARALYLSRGFEEVRRRRSYYRRPVEDAIVMVRQSAAGVPTPRGGTMSRA